MRGPRDKTEVRALLDPGISLLAICTKISRGGSPYFILVVEESEATFIIDEVDGKRIQGRKVIVDYMRGQDRVCADRLVARWGHQGKFPHIHGNLISLFCRKKR